MFNLGGGGGSHGHSHNGGQKCSHSHGGPSESSSGAKAPRANVGFGDDEDAYARPAKTNPMLAMMNSAMKNMQQQQLQGAFAGDKTAVPVNPMMAMMAAMQQQQQGGAGGAFPMPPMTPQMMEFAKKMFEQRQEMMRDFMAAGGQSNPEAVKDLMTKSARLQSQAMHEMKQMQQAAPSSESSTPLGPIHQHDDLDDDKPVNCNQALLPSAPSLPTTAGSGRSDISDMIDKKRIQTDQPFSKEDEEKRVLAAIERKDYGQLNIVRAVQYGVLERVRELLEQQGIDPNKPDEENVYLLHWAAINNRIEIAEYLLAKAGVQVDPVGGELESTPLNWAARSGHVNMVATLIRHGANPLVLDVEGFAVIHLATMFMHTNVVAYLLVKGVDPDMPDKFGVTPLMYAAQRVHSRDPAQLFITFNARINAQDPKGNTALHYCVAYNNMTVMDILINRGASIDIKNNKGLTAYELAVDRGKHHIAQFIRAQADTDKDLLPGVLRTFSKDKETRKLMTRLYPFLILGYLGLLFESTINWYYKFALLVILYPISFAFNRLFFDRNVLKYMPMAAATAVIVWLYVTWFVYFRPLVFDASIANITFVFLSLSTWYNFYKSYATNPGYLSANRDQMKQTILQFVEQNEFSLDNFCTSCIIRKPLRSKHCSECDRCVAKFDHHCPWVDNCIGQDNLKYFVGFICSAPLAIMFFFHGAYRCN